jgi:hypothetical protein
MLMDSEELSDDLQDYIEVQNIYPLFPSTRKGFEDHTYCRIVTKTNMSYLTELRLSDYQSYNINWELFNSWN